MKLNFRKDSVPIMVSPELFIVRGAPDLSLLCLGEITMVTHAFLSSFVLFLFLLCSQLCYLIIFIRYFYFKAFFFSEQNTLTSILFIV